MRPRRSLADRFWEKVDKAGSVPAHQPGLGPCWLWIAATTRGGYGKLAEGAPGNGWFLAHRVAFWLATGKLPNAEAMHRCDNPSCVKAWADADGPAHIVEGTQQDNVADRDAKRRHYLHVDPLGAVTKGSVHGQAVLTEETVRQLRRGLGGRTQRTVASELGVSPAALCNAINGKTWKHVT